jgi:hypothetical protein
MELLNPTTTTSKSPFLGGYGVAMEYLMLRDGKSGKNATITSSASDASSLPASSKFAGTKGVIVDSGATDTYLPSAFVHSFKTQFAHFTGGIAYSTEAFSLSASSQEGGDTSQLSKFPEIVFGLSGLNRGEIVEIIMPVSSYLDAIGDGKYAFRVFFSSEDGTILGSNFITGYNVIFDVDKKKISFGRSSCNYEELVPQYTKSPTMKPLRNSFDFLVCFV